MIQEGFVVSSTLQLKAKMRILHISFDIAG